MSAPARTSAILELAAPGLPRSSASSATIELDPTKPDGTPRKLMDIGKLRSLGWSPSISLEEGISRTWAELRDRGGFD